MKDTRGGIEDGGKVYREKYGSIGRGVKNKREQGRVKKVWLEGREKEEENREGERVKGNVGNYGKKGKTTYKIK